MSYGAQLSRVAMHPGCMAAVGYLKGTCDDALTTLAERYPLPIDTFHKGTHTLPAELQERHHDLPGPPPDTANIS